MVPMEGSLVKPLLQDLFQGGVYLEISPDNCIHLIKIRSPNNCSLVQKRSLFSENQTEIYGPGAGGISGSEPDWIFASSCF